jgi:phytanoyl-CoA hydroxylase
MSSTRTADDASRFAADGFLQVDAFLTSDEVRHVSDLYSRMLDGRIDTGRHRYDLGAGAEVKTRSDVENITQIMWPSDIHPPLREAPFRARAVALARSLFGDDTFEIDFDMLISKAPHTDTPTPQHQDQSYWTDVPDKRAVSFWIALDASTVDNGCMWYGRGTHLAPLRDHRKAGVDANSALMCDGSEEEMEPMPLPVGGAGLHQGRTLHYSRGNITDGWRRAYIVNCRPAAMIAYMRERGFDHGRSGGKSHEVRTGGEHGEEEVHAA